MSEHAKFGGSTINRTHNCPPWANFVAPLPKDGSSEYADRGTLLHQAMQDIYSADPEWDPRNVIGVGYEGITLTLELYEEKIVPAMAAVEAIFDRYNVNEGDFALEVPVKISEDTWGMADMLALGSEVLFDEDGKATSDRIKVGICLDYKFGDGIPVTAFENDQGLFYAVAASVMPDDSPARPARFFENIDLLVIAVVQPNDRGQDDFSVWEMDPGKLKTELVRIDDSVAYADALEVSAADPDGALKRADEFHTGDWCRFCPGNGICPPTSGAVAAMARLDVSAPDLIPNLPSFDELERVEITVKKIREFIHEQIEQGVLISGFKIVPKQARRSYSDEAAVREIVRRSKKIKRIEAYTDDLLSPAQLEKMCKRKKLDFSALFGAHVHKVSSGTTLVSEDDKREETPGIGALKALLDRK